MALAGGSHPIPLRTLTPNPPWNGTSWDERKCHNAHAGPGLTPLPLSRAGAPLAPDVAVVPKEAPLDKIGLLGCGITTGYGAVMNTIKVEPDTIGAVWGLGGVGLAVIMGLKEAGCRKIVAIDINEAKFPMAKV